MVSFSHILFSLTLKNISTNYLQRRFYVNIYTDESIWEKPTEPVYPPQVHAPPPPGPPPGYASAQQVPVDVKNAEPASLPQNMAAVSLSDGNQPYAQQQLQQPQYAYDQQNQPISQPGLQQATLQPGMPSPNPGQPRDYNGAPQNPQRASPQPAYAAYSPQPQVQPGVQPSYPPQQGYPQQQAGYPSPQPGQQVTYGQGPPQQGVPQQAAAGGKPAGGFMGMLNNKIGNKVPGGAGTVLGVGAGLLAGGLLEHEWDKHEDRERARHHRGFGNLGALGGLGGLMRGMGGPPIVENITVNNDDTFNNDTFNF